MPAFASNQSKQPVKCSVHSQFHLCRGSLLLLAIVFSLSNTICEHSSMGRCMHTCPAPGTQHSASTLARCNTTGGTAATPQESLLQHCRRHCCYTSLGTAATPQESLLQHCRRHCCYTSLVTVATLQEALLLHHRRHCCYTAGGTAATPQEALLQHRRRHCCNTSGATAATPQEPLLEYQEHSRLRSALAQESHNLTVLHGSIRPVHLPCHSHDGQSPALARQFSCGPYEGCLVRFCL
eukprot:1148655-Pelagomonas_calceolata.AAC.5